MNNLPTYVLVLSYGIDGLARAHQIKAVAWSKIVTGTIDAIIAFAIVRGEADLQS